MGRILTLLILFLIILQLSPVYAQQGNRFVFAQLKYDGKWDPYPETWKDILEFIVVTTNIKIMTKRRVLELNDKILFSAR